MGLLTQADKELVKRSLPKSSNKIIDVTVARLYIAYPDPDKWQYTGLSGAIVLVDDLVGHTYFLKLVDIKGHRGVLWDQELYVNFEYNQDRTFFHTFELEECYAGLSFVDVSDAAHFLKRVHKRERYASKKTLQNKNAIELAKRDEAQDSGSIKHGPRGEPLIDSQRQRYNLSDVEHIPDTKKKAPPPPPPAPTSSGSNMDDRSLQSPVSSIEQTSSAPMSPSITQPIEKPASGPKHNVPPLPPQFVNSTTKPPAPGLDSSNSNNGGMPFPIPQPLAGSSISPPPISSGPVPVPNRGQLNNGFINSVPPPPLPQQARPVPQAPQYGATANVGPVPAQSFQRNPTIQNHNGPPPPPPARRNVPPPPPQRHSTSVPSALRPSTTGFGATVGNHSRAVPPPPPSRRGPAPPPPQRASRPAMALPSHAIPHAMSPPPAPTLPIGGSDSVMPPNTFPMQPNQSGISAPSQMNQIPPAPPLNHSNVNTPTPVPSNTFGAPTQYANMAMNNNATPAPPINQSAFGTFSAAPPPPPPPPPALGNPIPTQPQAQTSVASGINEVTGDAGRDALLASIRGAGGIGALKKVDKSQLDKPSVLLQEARGEPTTNTNSTISESAPGAPTGGNSLADALASALNQRKNKISAQNDYDNGDDW